MFVDEPPTHGWRIHDSMRDAKREVFRRDSDVVANMFQVGERLTTQPTIGTNGDVEPPASITTLRHAAGTCD